MFEDEHLLEGGRCGSASHCETLSIAVASLSHQITLSQPPIAFTCSISLFAVFPLRTSPTGCPGVFQGNLCPYPSELVPVHQGTGFDRYGSWVGYNPRVIIKTCMRLKVRSMSSVSS